MRIARRVWTFACAALLSGAAGLAGAAGPGDAQREIAHLLQHLEASKCAFYRNGTWHTSQEARAHLETKYKAMQTWSRIQSTEDFLARAATASSISGEPYQVRCEGKAAVESAKWLGAELARYRSSGAGSGK